MMQGAYVVGVGAALVDLLVEEEDAFVARMGSEKGGMTLVELPTIAKAMNGTKADVKVVPGGSACNTMVGIGNLGGKARMIGRLGNDELGQAFLDGLHKAGVDRRIRLSEDSTGRVLSVVTPDAQRTMFTYLGASSKLSPEDVLAEDFRDAGIVLLEGYLLFNRPVVEKIISVVKGTKAKLVLDLASFQVVDATRDFLEHVIADSVDIILANEDEAKAYTGMGHAESLDILSEKAEIAVVKIGKDGVLIGKGKERMKVAGNPVKAIDTTGAGDLWASGFLYGLTQGMSLEKAASLGCKVGAEVVQVMGAVIPEEGWKRVKDYRTSLLRG
jgi:sugar/nucleoside kinase (ribokinase family)